jgi:hypothetical protein
MQIFMDTDFFADGNTVSIQHSISNNFFLKKAVVIIEHFSFLDFITECGQQFNDKLNDI